ncbi:acyclic terpene utilization AtuA family protein [Psychrobacillus sp. NPDC093180]|uniref:acyclic terpene utilization AtuA family protein n=1 Tax=Psychrobacillus sp. NPDC093180 TaxID=3364489 RepID=UPI0037FED258
MIRIGSGAGFAGDRIEPAEILVEQANLDYLVLECLAERTIALAQKRKKQDAHTGYDVLLEKRMRSLIPKISGKKVRIITNMGAANPIAGANKIIEIAKELNITLKVAAVTGDDTLTKISPDDLAWETEKPLKDHGQIVSANAYIGVDALLDALTSDAQIIIAGRIADPSLFLAPMIHEFNWSVDDYDLLAKGTVIGHLLECAGQLTGGYFADPGKKDIKDMANLGFPFADILADGSATFSKVESTGGQITLRTAKEQLLYEVVDPNAYITPDVIADFTSVKLEEISEGLIKVDGAVGLPMPQKLKVSIGYEAGYIGEGEISYAGPNATARASLAGDIIQERIGHLFGEFRVDLIGVNACHRNSFRESDPYEVRLRVAGKAKSMAEAAIIGEEVEALYTNGPAGGGGARKVVNEVIGVVSTFIDRDQVRYQTQLKEYVANETL